MEILAGGCSAVGACFFTNPLEVVKNRLQLQGELKARGEYTVTYRGPLHGLYLMGRTDGLRSLQAGLGPACWYQMVMNGLRLGMYAQMEKNGLVKDQNGGVSLARSLLCSAAAGCIAGLVGSPIFLVKTQLQTASSSTISVGHQHNHPGMIQAFRKIYAAGGLTGLWQGASSSIPRISLGSAAQLVTYGKAMESVERLGWFGKNAWQNNLLGAILSGFVVVITINPFDVVSTRLYNQPQKQRIYSGYLDCVGRILRTEGPLAFFKGLTAQYLRIGPHSFLSLVFWHHSRTYLGLIHT